MAKYPVTTYPWGGDYQPRAEAVIERGERALLVKMTAWEETIIGTEVRTGGAVCKDSCLEFFFMPCPGRDERYLNIETNAIGTMHIGVGAGRHDRVVLTEQPDGVRAMVNIVQGSKWSVRYELPYEWIQSMFPAFEPSDGFTIACNFYTCDESIHPHFGCAFPVLSDAPDFHRPESFVEIQL